MNPSNTKDEYVHSEGGLNASHSYLLPTVERVLSKSVALNSRLFEVGCGNGAVAAHLASLGYHMTGVDASSQGIAFAKKDHPELNLTQMSVYDDAILQFGTFPADLSLEVVEHLYSPRVYAARLFDLLEPGGVAIVSTVYHGYWKNLALALTGTMDKHFTALWDHGHIKFWSVKTLTTLLSEAGFRDIDFHRVGRIPPLAKSMIAVARKPISR